MKILLDTHYLIWLFTDMTKINLNTRNQLTNPNNLVLYSSVSIWEMSIKYNLGKLDLQGATPQDFLQTIQVSPRLKPLLIDNQIVASFYQLPIEHKDPFDRLLIWQAIEHDLHYLSDDEKTPRYVKYGLKLLEK